MTITIHTHFFSILTLFVFVYSQIQVVSAQTTHIQEEIYASKEGIANRYVTTIYQDKQDLVWVGTQGGLNVFDGYEFTIFNDQQEEAFKLSESFVEIVQETTDGRLAIIYRDNASVFDLLDPITYAIDKIKLNAENGIKGRPLSIRIHPKGGIFVLSIANEEQLILHQWMPEQRFAAIREFKILDSLKEQKLDYYVTENLQLWIKTDRPKIWEINLQNEWIDRTPLIHQTSFSENGQLAETIFFEDQSNRLWLSLANQPGLFVKPLHASFFSYATPMPKDLLYNRLWEDDLGNLLIVASTQHWRYARTEAVYLLNKKNEIQDFKFLLGKNNYLLAANSKDFNDVLFLGSGGLKIVKNNYSKVKTYFDTHQVSSAFRPVMRGMVEDSTGIIYAAKESNYWMKINELTGEVDTLPIKDKSGEYYSLQCAKNLVLQGKYLWGVSCNGETNGFLIRYNTETKTFKKYAFDYRLDYVLIDSKGKFWLIGDRGEKNGILLNFNPTSGKYSPYSFQENINPLAQVRPLYLYESRDQTIWIGTNDGLYFLNPNTSSYGVIKDDELSGIQLPSDHVMSIYEDNQGRLLLGTNKGLSIINRTDNSVLTYQRKDGLPNDIVCGILPDLKGNYWLSTFNGLSYFDTQTKLFRNFYSDDGLSDDEFNKLSTLRSKSGQFYFGGINGLTSFKSKELLQFVTPPAPLLTNITRFDNANDTLIEQTYNLYHLTDLTISPSIGYFQIEFILPQFINPSKNQFQIKLEGLDTDWSYLENNHSVRYNFLPPGDYTLKIKGADSKGNWSATSRDLNIHVQQVFYKKWWFIMLCSLGFTLLVFSLERYRSKQRLQVEKLRTKISSDLHDEVSGLLSGIAMQTDILQITITNEKNKQRLKKMGIVSRSAMSRMSDVIWSIDSRKDHLEDMLHRMHGHAEELLTPLQIPYNFALENLQKQKKIPVELRQNLYFIFKECINNIAKHSNASRVNITIRNTDNQFIMSIHDDGTKAQHAEKKPKPGQGLSNLEMRAKRIDAELEIDTTNGFLVEIRRKKI